MPISKVVLNLVFIADLKGVTVAGLVGELAPMFQ